MNRELKLQILAVTSNSLRDLTQGDPSAYGGRVHDAITLLYEVSAIVKKEDP